jgi:hypothetical protein
MLREESEVRLSLAEGRAPTVVAKGEIELGDRAAAAILFGGGGRPSASRGSR